jgi:hypothetical protein
MNFLQIMNLNQQRQAANDLNGPKIRLPPLKKKNAPEMWIGGQHPLTSPSLPQGGWGR